MCFVYGQWFFLLQVDLQQTEHLNKIVLLSFYKKAQQQRSSHSVTLKIVPKSDIPALLFQLFTGEPPLADHHHCLEHRRNVAFRLLILN